MKREEQVECLIAENRHLVGFVLDRLEPLAHVARLSRAELRGDGLVGLWKATWQYNPADGCFSTYATCIIKRTILKRIIHTMRQRRWPPLPPVSLSSPLSPEYPDGDALGDVLASDEPGPDVRVEAKEREALARQLLQGLSHVERQVIVERVMSDKTLLETAQGLAPNPNTGKPYTLQRVSQIECAAIKKMQRLAKQRGLNGNGG